MKPLVSLLRLFYRGLWWTVVSIIVTLGVVVAVARLGLPAVSEYRDEVQAWLNDEFGIAVEIGAVEANWHGLYPKLLVRQAILLDPDGRPSAVRVEQAQVALDVWASLRELRPQPAEVELSGIALHLLRERDGRVTLRGWPAVEGATDWNAVADWVLHHDKIHLLDARLTLEDEASGLAVELRDVDLYLLSIDTGHRLTASAVIGADPSAGPARPVLSAARVELAADLVEAGRGGGHYYLALEDLALDLPPAHGIPPLKSAALRLWAERLNDDWSGFAAELGATVLGESRSGEGLELRPSLLSGQRTQHSWHLHAEPLQQPAPTLPTFRPRPPISGTGLWLDAAIDAEAGHALDIKVDRVRAEAVAGLLRGNPWLPPMAREKLAGLAPQGELDGLTLRKQPDRDGVVLKASFAGLRSHHWRGIPALDALAGGFAIDTGLGRVSLQAGGGAVRFGELFEAPWPIDRLNAELLVHTEQGGVRVDIRQLLLENPDLAVNARGSVSVPRPDDSNDPGSDGPELDLVADIIRGQGNRMSPYLPRKYMPLKAREWINRAMVAGTVTGGSAVFRGPAKRYPFNHEEGMFEVSFDVDDAIIDYAEGWPRLEQVDAEVVFRQQEMHIRAVGGRIFDAEMTRVDVRLPNMKQPGERGHVVSIDGELALPVDEVRHFILNSPLSKPYGPLVESLDTTGRGALQLKLVLPLKDLSKTEVSGTLVMSGTDLHWRRSGLELKRVHGSLSFDGSGLHGRDIRARFLGLPTRVAVVPGRERGHNVTRIKLSGRLGQSFIERTLGKGWSARFSGQSRWNATITTPQDPNGPVKPQVEFKSDLKGLAIELPAPIGKSANQGIGFRIGTTLADQRKRKVWFGLGKRVGGILEFDPARNTLLRGELRFGQGDAELPVRPRLEVGGRIRRLSVDDWIEVFQTMPRSEQGAEQGPGQGKTDGGADWLARLHQADLKVGRLDLFEQRYSDLSLRLRHRAPNWLLNVDGDAISGRITIPTATATASGRPGRPGGELVMDMQRLFVIPPGKEGGADNPPDPRKLPALRATIEDFRFDGLALGRLELITRRDPSGLVVKPFKLDSELLHVDADGRWQMNKGKHHSYFHIVFNGPDLGGMFDQLGFAGTIKGGQTEGDINAEWAGAPSQFELGRLNGTFDIKIGSGSLLQLDPGAGRLFALLSPQVLTRSLAERDRELTSKGFYFDKIEGSYELKEGNAYTESLTVEGPVARIDISGRIGLLAEDYNQYVKVTPRVSGGMTVATGAVALANPPLGAAMLLAQTVFGSTIDKLGNRYYLISGNWDDPQVTRLSRPRGDKK